MKNRDFNMPGVEELYALERAARLARSREMAKFVRRAVKAVRHALETKDTRGLRHA